MPAPSILNDAMLGRFSERAAVYDQENRFFSEDFEELRKAGYLTMAVPKEFGGGGASIVECCRAQRQPRRRHSRSICIFTGRDSSQTY